MPAAQQRSNALTQAATLLEVAAAVNCAPILAKLRWQQIAFLQFLSHR